MYFRNCFPIMQNVAVNRIYKIENQYKKQETKEQAVSYTIVVFVKQVPDTKNVTGQAMKPDGTINR